MSVDAASQIREAMADENAQRRRRGVALLGLWGLGAAGLSVGLGPRTDFTPIQVLGFVLIATFLLFGTLTAFLPHLRFGTWTARGIAGIALLSPLFAARVAGSPDSALAGGFACMGTIVALGFGALVGGRLVMGAYRRRFGGALLLQGMAAAMVACLAVGLHCPMSDAAHLLTHVAGAVLVAAVLRRLTLSA